MIFEQTPRIAFGGGTGGGGITIGKDAQSVGSSTVLDNQKQAIHAANELSLEQKINRLSPEALVRVHDQLSEYTSFIKQQPKANKENYETQEELITNILPYTQRIIQHNQPNVGKHAHHLQAKIERCLDRLPSKDAEISVITNWDDRIILLTDMGHPFDLATGAYQNDLRDIILDRKLGTVVGAHSYKPVNQVDNELLVLGRDGSMASSRSNQDPVSSGTNVKNKGHGPYKEVFSDGKDTSFDNLYGRTTNDEIVQLATGKLSTTPELEQIKTYSIFSYKGDDYTYVTPKITPIKPDDKPEYEYTSAFENYLSDLL